MKLTDLNGWLTDQQINAICWTLIHSLWIGLVIAVFAAIIIVCTRTSTGNLRYRLFCSLLILFVLAVTGAWITEMTGIHPAAAPDSSSKITSIEQAPAGNLLALDYQVTPKQRIISFLNQHSVWIFVIWLVCFLLKMSKLLAGIFYVQRIRSYKSIAINTHWNAKLQQFSTRMGIKKKVSIIESTLTKIPVAIGYLKPVIVLPVGLVCQLPAEQVETILWHELAHIYRRDYLVNLLQRTVEAVFFFNPAVLWLSELIREEREACCDEIVLDNVPHKINYLHALAAFHTDGTVTGSLAMGLCLRPHQLMSRLKRMVNKENSRLSMVEFVLLLVGMMIFSAFTLIPQVTPELKNGALYLKKVITESPEKSKPNKLSIQKISNKKLAPVKNLVIKADTLWKFKSIRFKNSNEDRNNREVNVSDWKNNLYHLIMTDGKLSLVEVNGAAVPAIDYPKYEPMLTQIDQLIDQKLANFQFKKDRGYQPYQKERELGKEISKASPDPDKEHPESEKTNLKLLPTIDASGDKARVLGVINSLVENQVVPDAASVLWFALTEDQLVVNDRKLSLQLHRHLKEKYGVKTNYGLFYGPSQVHGTGIVFDKGDL